MTGASVGGIPPVESVGYLGPPGTFTEEALLSQADLSERRLVAYPTVTEVLDATQAGEVEIGFVPLENAIEGSVNVTLDHLVFDCDLFIQREVISAVRLHLMSRPETELESVRTVVSFPVASAQCRRFLATTLAGVELVPASSTADAARLVGEGALENAAAIAPALCAKLYDLEIRASDVEDHEDNQTRFVAVSRSTVPPPTGHDKTSIVCFQHTDRPGNLHMILGQFAARGINLTRLESRPTKKGLGDYCFVIDLEGHIADELVADCLRELHAELRDVKFLGSYPAAGERSHVIRAKAGAAWSAASAWVDSLRARVRQVP
jgi:prephenate dehydratase